MRGFPIGWAIKLAVLACCLLGGVILLALTGVSFFRADEVSYGWMNMLPEQVFERIAGGEPVEHRVIDVTVSVGMGACRVRIGDVRSKGVALIGQDEGWRHRRQAPASPARDSWSGVRGNANAERTLIGWPDIHYFRMSRWGVRQNGAFVPVTQRPEGEWVTLTRSRWIAFPIWLPGVVLLIPPVLAFIRHRRRHMQGFPVVTSEPTARPDEPAA